MHHDSAITHMRVWFLGDKLLCVPFQNHAMSALYSRDMTDVAVKPVTPDEFAWLCANTPTVSTLRAFFINLVAKYFTDAQRVQGTPKQWDEVLQEHGDARRLAVKDLMKQPWQRAFKEGLHAYLEIVVEPAMVPLPGGMDWDLHWDLEEGGM
jgi:hypothetical protein